MIILDRIQNILDFRNWEKFPQFIDEQGHGRIALIACILSSILTTHLFTLCLIALNQLGLVEIGMAKSYTASSALSSERLQMIVQWMLYAVCICIFHLAEFFVTALYNPSVVKASSFIVNHSKSYTIAMMVSGSEFFLRFLFYPSMCSKFMSILGLLVVSVAQFTRSLGMVTCGESFNHMIQKSKKNNHLLVTSGIYKYLRHPSYFGFFYWSVGTQIVLGNWISTFLFGAASWMFFNRRIPFEEQTLLKMFPDEYPQYFKTTYIGIPFIRTTGIVQITEDKSD